MHPYREIPPDPSISRRAVRFAMRLRPRPVSFAVIVGALGWPAFFAATMTREPARGVEASGATVTCVSEQTAPVPASSTGEHNDAPVEHLLSSTAARASVERTAREVITALDGGDFAGLAFHAAVGGVDVVVSSDADADNFAHFSADALRRCAQDRRKRVWRGSTEARTCAGFFAEVLNGGAFSESVHVTYNDMTDDSPFAKALRKGRGEAIISDHVLHARDGAEEPDQDRAERHIYLTFLPEGDSWRLTAIAGD
jgi:hypothetical protein